MTDRRTFIKNLSAAGILGSMPRLLQSQVRDANKELIWANLLHLSYNMWTDHSNVAWDDLPADHYTPGDFDIKSCMDARRWARGYRPFLTFDHTTFTQIMNYMASRGMNMVIIDVGDAVRYDSHPEIAVEDAWPVSRLRNEVAKIKKMGLEPIPKLNFATTHDAWLGEYSRMVSTEKYYTVCRNLIKEVIDIFDNPRFFHLGMDEETPHYQRRHLHMVVRQGELWWHDFYLLMEEVEKHNSRPWIWSDYAWKHPEEFFKKMPTSVLQSNWYYGTSFGPDKDRVKYYNEFSKRGYDQVPTGSSHSNPDNFRLTVEYCKESVDPHSLLGFMQTAWRPTLPACTDRHLETVDQVARAMKHT